MKISLCKLSVSREVLKCSMYSGNVSPFEIFAETGEIGVELCTKSDHSDAVYQNFVSTGTPGPLSI